MRRAVTQAGEVEALSPSKSPYFGVNDKFLSHERLLEAVYYCPDTGVFTWRISTPGRLAGRVAGSRKDCKYASSENADHRYPKICIDRKTHKLSRLAWFYMTGEWPQLLIDHINRDTWDDRWLNLRLATPSQNACNRKKKSKSGVHGVALISGRWCAEVVANGEKVKAYFDDIGDAISWRDARAKQMHGAFALLNVVPQ